MKKVLLCVLILGALQAEAMAGNYPVIIQVNPLIDIRLVAKGLGGTVLDSIPGANTHLDAPGVNIISAYPGGRFAMVSGTSFSAPIVAAEAALIMAAKNVSVKNTIGAATINIDAQNPDYAGRLGHGRIDMLSAVR